MPKRVSTPAPVPPTLKTQKTDFTAEGAPPPGLVSTVPPVVPGPKQPRPKPARRPG